MTCGGVPKPPVVPRSVDVEVPLPPLELLERDIRCSFTSSGFFLIT